MMIKEIADAIEREDYQTADYLLKHLKGQETDSPWVQFYMARLKEAKGNLDDANKIYRALLVATTNPKLISHVRQGINRISKREEEVNRLEHLQRKQALNQAKSEPGSGEIGVLVLEPISQAAKQTCAQQFARIMQIDPYTARLQLPSRALKLYRVGAIGELRVYVHELQTANIPCLCASLEETRHPNVYQVQYFESIFPRVTVVYELRKGDRESITFNWREVTQRVEGIVPLFEECVDMNARRQLERKTKTLDYVQLCDLHLPERNLILRLCNHTYEFYQGVAFTQKQNEGQTTSRDNWNHLIQTLKQQLPEIPVWSEFTPFAETAIDFQDTLGLINPHIHLLRREDSYWDAAFQLYSSLIFLKKSSQQGLCL